MLSGQNRLRMELHAVDRVRAMLNPHDCAVIEAGDYIDLVMIELLAADFE